MKLSGHGTLLRVFTGEKDSVEHRPLYEAIVTRARASGLAGATVLRGVMGFGARSRTLHTAKILRLSEDLPIVVEIVDTEEKVAAFLPAVDALIEASGGGCLVTLEQVDVIRYAPGA
jgi:PII-like signaling protein